MSIKELKSIETIVIFFFIIINFNNFLLDEKWGIQTLKL